MKTPILYSIFHIRNESGFTLIEAMIAITILTLSISGPLFTANSAILSAETARDQLTASYLAQEGIEYVRMMRDDAFLAAYGSPSHDTSNAWNDFVSGESLWSITSCVTVACTLDPTLPMGHTGGYALAAYAGNAPLYLLANGVYSQRNLSGSVIQPFTRTIRATRISDTDERIVSTVSWSYHSRSYTITIYDHLTPWQ